MDRFAQVLAWGLLLAGAAVAAGCGSSAGGLITGSTSLAGDSPGGITNEDPLARPIGVAWTSARAHRCGFYFDPNKLRTSYLAFEAKEANAEQLAKAEKTYDSTFKVIRERVGADPDYCTDKNGAEIKANLQRHLAGDFAPNFPAPKKVAADPCGFFGCPSSQKWDAEKWWKDEEQKRGGRR
jgi:hypothetical protein